MIAAVLAGLAGCTPGGDTAPLNITGVDYAGRGIDAFAVVDPDDPDNRGGGMSITPYSAGGVQCCYQLPEEWHEGMTVNVIVRYPLEGDTGDEISASYAKRKAEGTLKHNIQVTVPEYNTPARGTLWVQFLPENKASVVVSNLDPSHPDFPGEMKGWPEPSDEYRAKMIDREIKDISSRVSRTADSLEKIKRGDEAVIKQYWDIRQDTAPKDIAGFSGWDDPEFKKYLEDTLEWYVTRGRADLDKLRELKP